MAWVMPKHLFKKLYRELKIFVNTVIVTNYGSVWYYNYDHNNIISQFF